MFHHTPKLQFESRPERPDPVYAKQLQEVLGGQWGEISVAMSYLFQGWNCRGPAKYRDMLLDVATEEIGHCEMLATLIARLLEDAPEQDQRAAAQDPAVGAVMGGTPFDQTVLALMNPQHNIVQGRGAAPNDSVGYPWNARYTIASGNLLADFRYNVTAESQGRLQVARLHQMTDDQGVRNTLEFLLARDTMHQNQWLAAIEELEQDGLEMTPVPSSFPQDVEKTEVSYKFLDFSEGEASREGRWAAGPSPDGKGRFEHEKPTAYGPAPELGPVNPRLWGTPKAKLP